MPPPLLKKIESDPEFSKLSPKARREILRDVLSRDKDFQTLSDKDKTSISGEIFARHPDKATKPAAPITKPKAKIGAHVLSYPKGAPPNLSISQRPPAQYDMKAPPVDEPPPLLKKGLEAAGKVSEVLSTPAGAVKAAAQPLKKKLGEQLGKMTGARTDLTPEDIAEQERISKLPFGQRVLALRGQDWRTLGLSQRTQMERVNRDKNDTPLGQAFGAVGGLATDLATDPLTLATGGGSAVGKKIVGKVAEKLGAGAAAKTAKALALANRGVTGAFAAQQLSTGVPSAIEGARTGNFREAVQGGLGALMGGYAAKHAIKGTSLIPERGTPLSTTGETLAQNRRARSIRKPLGARKAGEPSALAREEVMPEERTQATGTTIRPTGAGGATTPAPLTETKNAIQIRRPTQEVPRPTAGGENIPEGGSGIRQSLEGQEAAGTRQTLPEAQTQIPQTEGMTHTIRDVPVRIDPNRKTKAGNPVYIDAEGKQHVPTSKNPAVSTAPDNFWSSLQQPETTAAQGGKIPAPTEPVTAENLLKQGEENVPATQTISPVETPSQIPQTMEPGSAGIQPHPTEATAQPETPALTPPAAISEPQAAAPPGNLPPTETPAAPTDAVSDFSRMRMRDLEAAGERFGFDLPDRADYSEARRMQLEADRDNYDELMQSVLQYDPAKTPTLTNSMHRVAAAEARALGRQLDGATPRQAEAIMGKLTTISQNLHRSSSERGAQLQFLKNIVEEVNDPAGVLQRLEKATDGKASPAAKASVVDLSNQYTKEEAAVRKRQAARAGAKGFEEEGWGSKNVGVTTEQADAARNKINKVLITPRAIPNFTDLTDDLVTLARFHYEAGAKKFNEWTQAIQSEIGGAADKGELETIWAGMREAQRGEKGTPQRLKPESFTDRLAQKIGRDNVGNFLEGIADADGTPTILNKMLDGTQLSPAEKKQILTAWQKNAPLRKKTTETGAAKVLSDIISDARKESAGVRAATPEAQQKRATGVQERAQKILNTLGEKRIGRPKPTISDIHKATYDFAKGARSLDAFARAMRERYGDTVDPKTIQDLFREAATQYSKDTSNLDAIKAKIGETIVKEAQRNMSPAKKLAWRAIHNLDAFRAIMTSLDLSGYGRQGGILVGSHPIESRKAFAAMLRAAATKGGYDAVLAEIAGRRYAQNGYYAKAELDLTSNEAGSPVFREEDFSAPDLEKIKILGRPVAASARAYTAVLDRLRADRFDVMVGELERRKDAQGQPIPPTDRELKDIGKYINIASGRGQLHPTLAQAAPVMANLLFSPRFLTSRFQYLMLEPLRTASGNIFKSGTTRNLIGKEYARYGTAVLTMVALAKQSGAEVETDPHSTDFLVMRFPNGTEVDALAGLKQAAVFMARELSGQYKSQQGETLNLNEPATPISPTRFSVGTQFGRSKEAPVPAAIHNLYFAPRQTEESKRRTQALASAGIPERIRNERKEFTGSDYLGRPTNPLKESAKLLSPIIISSFLETMLQEGVPEDKARAAATNFGLEVFGVTSNYRDRERESMEKRHKKALSGR